MLGKSTRRLEKGVENATNILCYVGMGMLVVLMLLGAGDVIGRYFFNKPITGTREISEILLAGVVFFGWSYTQLQRGHVSVGTFVARLRPRARAIIASITSLIALIIFGLMAWQAAERAIATWKGGRLINTIFIPVAPFQLFVSVGAVVLCLVLAIQTAHFITQARKGS